MREINLKIFFILQFFIIDIMNRFFFSYGFRGHTPKTITKKEKKEESTL